jgi:arabinogalactan oligomer/maltooligosaccharide transport system substrate-binding protein
VFNRKAPLKFPMIPSVATEQRGRAARFVSGKEAYGGKNMSSRVIVPLIILIVIILLAVFFLVPGSGTDTAPAPGAPATTDAPATTPAPADPAAPATPPATTTPAPAGGTTTTP